MSNGEQNAQHTRHARIDAMTAEAKKEMQKMAESARQSIGQLCRYAIKRRKK